ncbi:MULTISPECIES: SDR family oxidoreductase [Achromobacter]|nr:MULTISPECIES: SDR family oxidoreductase [Achromobacter]
MSALDQSPIHRRCSLNSSEIRSRDVLPSIPHRHITSIIHSRERLAQVGPQLPMKRPGTAAEVADTVMWLLSPAASYVAGTNVGVSGAR